MRFGFVGASHPSRSVIANGQRCVNLYPEPVEGGKNSIVLYGTPGLKVFSTLGDSPVRALFQSDEDGARLIAVAGGTVYDLDEGGTATSLGSVADGNDPVSISYNGSEYLIISQRTSYILEGTTVTEIADLDLPDAIQGVFLDGYFIVIKEDSQEIYISSLYDGTSWNALDFASVEASPDQVRGIFSNHGELWLFGSQKTEIWYNSGNVDFPFERIPGAIMEQGIDARNTIAKVANSVMWLGGSNRGRGIVFLAEGFIPRRVSSHAIETAIQGYRTDDAEAYAYQEDGHEFYVLSFPTNQRTWVFDVTTGMWHERGYWDPRQGYTQVRGRCHVYAYDSHYVGDFDSGNVYEQRLDYYDDAGDAIRRVRRSPHVADEHFYLFHHSLTVDMEVGVGTQTGQGSDPKALLYWSDDGGKTWANPREASIGKIGETLERVKFNRLGVSRDRVYELVISDPVKVALIDAYLEVTRGAA